MKKYVALILILILPVAGGGNAGIVEKEQIHSNREIFAISKFCSIEETGEIHLINPRMAHPVIVDKNQNFTIEFSSPSFDRVSIEISTSYNPLPDLYELEVEKIWNDGVWHVAVNTGNSPYELYNLTIIVYTGTTQYIISEPKCVAIEEIDGNFSFIHLTDLHIGDPRGMSVSVRETIGWKAARKCIEEINLLHPSFVIITGDVVFGQLYPFEYKFEYKKLYEILQEFDVPVFLCPGNHDGYIQSGQDGFDFWKEYFGWLNYSFDYGKSHFIMVNSYDWPEKSRVAISYAAFNWGGYIGDEQMKWIEKDIKKCRARLKVLALHHNPLWDTSNDSLFHNPYYNREKLLGIIWKYGVDAVLSGHVHYDYVEKVNDTLFITTTTAASSLGGEDAYWGYRLIQVENWSIKSYNYMESKFSIPSYHINSTIEGNKAIIENKLNMDINVRISFYVENRTWNVENGEILKERKRGNFEELYVVSAVPANSKLEIRIF